MKLPNVKEFVLGIKERAINEDPANFIEAQAKELIINKYVPEILKALEKQEPKKWLFMFDVNGDPIYRCENCKEDFILVDGTPKDNNYTFCPCCGQCLEEPPAAEININDAYINESALRDLILPKENGEDSEAENGR